jgi:hypothetical protein
LLETIELTKVRDACVVESSFPLILVTERESICFDRQK